MIKLYPNTHEQYVFIIVTLNASRYGDMSN